MSERPCAPLSWLLLERYVLGELSAAERSTVETRLASSAVDRARVAFILNDRVELAPLERDTRLFPRRARSARGRTLLWLGSTALAAACALLVMRAAPLPAVRDAGTTHLKGGDVAVGIHGDLQGEAPTTFREDERYKLFVTCPAHLRGSLHVLVFQAGAQYRPLAEAPTFGCGNRVPWPGAFQLTGSDDADVCVSWAADDAAAAARRASDLGERAVCVRLTAPH